MPRITSLFTLTLLFAPLGQAAWYTFTPLPESATARVTVKLERSEAKEFRMPAWAPGDYEIFNYGRFIERIEFRKDGSPVAAIQSKADPNLWSAAQGADEAVYIIRPSRGNFSPNLRVTANQTFVSGPGVFGWFVGDELNRQFLDLSLHPTGASAYSNLERQPGSPAGRELIFAPNYDELIDAPLVMGTGIRTQEFQVRGKTLKIVAFNRSSGADLASFVKIGVAAAESSHDLFGELPFSQYTFYCDFGGPGGGLEHLNSCRLGIGAGTRGEHAAGLIFHEFVHLYNVKRIRPKPLGPFDYTKPALTSSLWWLEGVTDYYAAVLALRSGIDSKERFLGDMSASLSSFSRNPNRLKVSAEESSLRVWEAPGSFGFGGISYYEKGRLIGLLLDMGIRGRSNGKHSLDNVMRDLYNETKPPKTGYEEGRIRELCIKYGGASMGPLYDACARQRVELPIAETAALIGMRWDGAGLSVDLLAGSGLQRLAEEFPAKTDPAPKGHLPSSGL